MIFGALVLHAARRVPPYNLESLQGLPVRSGHHSPGRYVGAWTEVADEASCSIYLPQRYKHLTVTSTNGPDLADLTAALEGLDSQYLEARQLYKLNQLLATREQPFAAIVNIAAAVQEGRPVSGSFYLLSLGTPLYLYLVFDLEAASTSLVWATYDFKPELRSRDLLRYVFFALPVLVNRPVFVPTQAICARWWKWIKAFDTHPMAVLKTCNALESLLFKDPTIQNY